MLERMVNTETFYQRLKENIRRGNYLLSSFAVLAVISVLFTICFFVLWAYTIFRTPSILPQQEIPVALSPSSENVLTFYIQSSILVNDPPAELIIALAEVPCSSPIAVSISLPSGIIQPSAPAIKIINKEFDHFCRASNKISISNAGVLSSGQDVDLRYQVAYKGSQVEGEIPIFIEGTRSAKLRSFASTTVNDRSPIMLALAAAAMVVGWSITQYFLVRTRQFEEHEKLDNITRQLIAQWREDFIKEDTSSAQEILEKLMDRKYAGHIGEAKTRMDSLLMVFEGRASPSEMVVILENCLAWPDESAVAYLGFWKKNSDSGWPEPRLLRQHLLELATDHRLKTRLQELVITDIDLPREIPIIREPLKLPESKHPLCLQHFGGADPLGNIRAEQEEEALFGVRSDERGLYWELHSLYCQLVSSSPKTSNFIEGSPGSGRTAMALALSRYPRENQNTLGVYWPKILDPGAILRSFSREMLQLIERKPLALAKITGAETELVARTLADQLGVSYVAAVIGAAQRGLPFKFWGRNDEIDKINLEKKQYWKTLANQLLANLLQRLEDYSPENTPSDIQGLQAVHRCARSLGFEHLRLALDVQDEQSTTHFGQHGLPLLDEWMACGLEIYAFMPREVVPGEDFKKLVFQELVWDNSVLEKMALHRFTRVRKQKGLSGKWRENVFEGDAFTILLNASLEDDGAPGRFIHLWKDILQNNRNARSITEDDANSAVKRYRESVESLRS